MIILIIKNNKNIFFLYRTQILKFSKKDVEDGLRQSKTCQAWFGFWLTKWESLFINISELCLYDGWGQTEPGAAGRGEKPLNLPPQPLYSTVDGWSRPLHCSPGGGRGVDCSVSLADPPRSRDNPAVPPVGQPLLGLLEPAQQRGFYY